MTFNQVFVLDSCWVQWQTWAGEVPYAACGSHGWEAGKARLASTPVQETEHTCQHRLGLTDRFILDSPHQAADQPVWMNGEWTWCESDVGPVKKVIYCIMISKSKILRFTKKAALRSAVKKTDGSKLIKSDSKGILIKWFMKDHVTLKTGIMAAENSALHHRNKLHLKNIFR